MKRPLLPPLPLGRWFLLWMLLVTIAILGLSVAVVSLHLRSILLAQLEARGRGVARALAFDALQPSHGSLGLTAMPECVAARVTSGDGTTLWSFGPPAEEALAIDPALFAVGARVVTDGGEAEAELLLSTTRVSAQVLGTGARLAASLTAALAIVLLVGALLVHSVVAPLQQLAEHARTLDPDSPVAVEVTGGGAREVADLAEAFGQMGQRLARERRSLAESEHRYRELFLGSPTPLLEVGQDLAARGANPAAAPFLGDGVRESAPARLDELLTRAAGSGELPLPAAEGEETVVAGRWRLPDGDLADVELHTRRLAGGPSRSYLMSIHDLTDIVRRQGERWRRTFDEMADGVALVDSAGTITLANRAMEPYLPTLAPEVTRRHCEQGRQEWQTTSGDRVLRCLLSDSGGAECILVARDVTDWVRAEERLREVQKMEAVATLAGGVAHDFNNLLAGILLHVRLLERDPASREEATEAIRALAEEGSEVVRGLLLFARPEIARQALDLAAVVSEQGPLLRHVLPPTVQLSLALEPPSAAVFGSPGDLRRLLLNLVLNARDAMGEDGGRITVGVREEPGWALLEVADSGPGVPPELRERIFEPFFTLHRSGRGAGLGLAVVYAIVREHDGTVEVGSSPAGGARFTVRLPLRADLERPGPADAEVGVAQDLAGAGQRVLLVDDEPAIRERLADELTAAGYRVRTAEGLESACETAQTFEPQAAVLDLLLPDGSGADLARQLRAAHGELPVVFVSGHLEADTRADVRLARSVLLAKPFAPEALLRQLSLLLGPDREAG